jgi:hypothetical protein
MVGDQPYEGIAAMDDSAPRRPCSVNTEAQAQVRQLQESVQANLSMIARTKALIAKLTDILLGGSGRPSSPA